MNEIEKYLIQKIKPDDYCVLALSGGPDSMCLLTLLMKVTSNIICVHINHNTRDNNEKEYLFVKDYLSKKHIKLEYVKIDKYQKGKFTEEEARNIRYAKFKEIAHKYNAKFLLTAHHGDDLTETIIMRLLRGSSLEGYAGIKKETIWDNIVVLRPLISKKKKEIYEYLHSNNIPYVEDETNQSDSFLRNRIRHHILPLLEQENPKYPLKMLEFSERLQEKKQVIDDFIEKIKLEIEIDKKIDCQKFSMLSESIQKTYAEYYLKSIYQNEIGYINSKHKKIFLDCFKNSKSIYQFDFPKNFILQKADGYIWLDKKIDKNDLWLLLEDEINLPNNDIIKKIKNYEEKSNFEIHLNSKQIKLPLYITTRKKGMKMEVKNLKGHKKISDILTNSKVRGVKKDQIPILVDSNGQILWVLGIKKSKYDLEKDENYDIIYKYIKRKEK